jgi:SAM-dependent methyltransferase
VYKFAHNDGVGSSWQTHNENFVDFISKFEVHDILEIGCGSGNLAKIYLARNINSKWHGLEPNYEYTKNLVENFTLERVWFDKNYKITKKYDAIVHSNIFEHSYNPIEFLNSIRNKMDDGYHFISVPNLYNSLKNKFTNQLNFEHTLFLTEDIIDIILQKVGFAIIEKVYNKGLPAIFYCCEKDEPKDIDFPTNIYTKNKKVFEDFVRYWKIEVDNLNEKIRNFDGEIYLFGAHIFSQFLIYNGLNIKKINGIIDNSRLKNGKRLYGTKFSVEYPNVLKNKKDVAIILKVANYTNEIKNQILDKVNSKVKFWG